MSTNAVPPLISQVLNMLDEATQYAPIMAMMAELHLVIERLSFHEATSNNKGEYTQEDLNMLLDTDVSPAVGDFVTQAADRGMLKLFVGEAGKAFLGYCAKHYRLVPEIIISTPIELQSEFRGQLITQLRMAHPFPARLIFKTEPSLLVGCMIKTPGATHNYSLKQSMLNDIATRLQGQSYETEVARG